MKPNVISELILIILIQSFNHLSADNIRYEQEESEDQQQHEDHLQQQLDFHHLGSKDVFRLSKLERYLSLKAHDRHLRRLKQLYDDDVYVDGGGSDFGREFFATAAGAKPRAKRGGNENIFQQQNDPGYVALPLPPLPDDVLDNLSEVQLFGRPNRDLIRLASELSEQRNILPPVVNPIPPKTAPPPADSFEKVPKFPSSIQDIMVDMGIAGYPPSDQGYPPEYHQNPPLKYPPFTHKPSTKPPVVPYKEEKATTAKPKKPKADKPVVPVAPVVHHPKPPAPTLYPNSIQDVMHQIGVLEPHYQVYNPPVVYPPAHQTPYSAATTKKPKKKKKSKKTKQEPEKQPEHKPEYKPVHKHEPGHTYASTKAPSYPATKSPSYPATKAPSYEPTTPVTYVHTRPTEVVRYDDHTRAPEPFPASPPKQSSSPKDPNNYMAVIPYKDVYKLFEMMNKHVSPTKMPRSSEKRTTTPLPPATTKRTEQLRAKVVKKTPDEGWNKKKKRKKPKKTVSVSF